MIMNDTKGSLTIVVAIASIILSTIIPILGVLAGNE